MLKRWIGLTCIALLLMGCQEAGPAPSVEEETPSVPTVPAFTMNPDRTYLWENPLVIEERNQDLIQPNITAQVNYPQISGLVDQEVESRINKRLEGVVTTYRDMLKAEAQALENSRLGGFLYYYLPLNHNGILVVELNSSYHYGNNWKDERVALCFDLSTGEEIKLEALFLPGAAYGQAIDQWLVRHVLEQNLEDNMLIRPLPAVDENQLFYLTAESLVIYYPEGNPYFMNGYSMSFQIPFHQLAEPMVAFDRFEADVSLFKDPLVKKYMLASPFTLEPRSESWYQEDYNFGFNTVRIRDLSNPALEKHLNELIEQEEVEFVNGMEAFVEAAQAYYQEEDKKSPSSLHLQCGVSGVGKILSLTVSEYAYLGDQQTSRFESRVYHLETGQQLDLEELFVAGYDFFPVMDQYVEARLQEWYPEWEPVKEFAILPEQQQFHLYRGGISLRFGAGQIFEAYPWEIEVTIPFETFDGNTIFD